MILAPKSICGISQLFLSLPLIDPLRALQPRRDALAEMRQLPLDDVLVEEPQQLFVMEHTSIGINLELWSHKISQVTQEMEGRLTIHSLRLANGSRHPEWTQEEDGWTAHNPSRYSITL